MIAILYPSGGHGAFLNFLLNELTGMPNKKNDSMIYDGTLSQKHNNIFHKKPINACPSEIVNIRINPDSYLKYLAVCLNRTSGHNIIIEELHIDTYEKIKVHSIISHFDKSLRTIANGQSVNVEPKFLREWFRLCFFADQGETITKFISPSVCNNAGFVVDFEDFYNGKIEQICIDICNKFKLSIVNHDLNQHLIDFRKKNRYHDIDLNISAILDCIKNKQEFDLSQTNIMQQAWIDNFLVDNYNVDPLLENQYFSNTLDLINTYKL